MRRILTLILAVLLLAPLFACDDDGCSKDGTGCKPPEEAMALVGLS